MTIAISIKVNDGVVLASDSASTMIAQDIATKQSIALNIYNNANKIFNIMKGVPIGAITWGSGSVGQASISTLVKDFRELIIKNDEWKIDPTNYSIEDFAIKFKKFIFDETYVTEFENWKEKPALGFMLAGYSSGELLAEEWKIDIDNGKCNGPYRVREQKEIGLTCNGEPEAITRLIFGFSNRLPNVLREAGLDKPVIDKIIKLCGNKLQVGFVTAPMPIQDTIDLATFLVDTTINFSRFHPGAPTVGGPIEVAAITKHEGFNWVHRKHYFDKKLNPTGYMYRIREDTQ